MLTMTTTYSTPTPNKGKKPYKSWLKDGVSGGPCSMDILVRWLSIKANFAKWRGDESERTPKKVLLENILDTMRGHGIQHRLAKDIASKISTLQSNYRVAREWYDTEGRRLLDAGTEAETIHEELLKRFPYWDSLHETFGTRTSSWPMSISNIMHCQEEQQQQQQQQLENELLQQVRHHQQQLLQDDSDEMPECDDYDTAPSSLIRRRLGDMHTEGYQLHIKRRRRLSDSTLKTATDSLQHTKAELSIDHQGTSFTQLQQHSQHHLQQYSLSPPLSPPSSSACSSSSSSSPSPVSTTLIPPMVIRPMPRSFQQPYTLMDDTKKDTHHPQDLADSLLLVTREKEAARMKRSEAMLDFLREKRRQKDQLLREQEKTKRIAAQAELVKNLVEAGFTKGEIYQQLQRL